ncbi:MAG: hypothetical protein AAF517_05975 [Planctomycetota bacterium]
MPAKPRAKLILSGVIVVLALVVGLWVSDPTIRARYQFWREHTVLDEEFPGIQRLKDRDGVIWHLVSPTALVDPIGERGPKNYYPTEHVLQVFAFQRKRYLLIDDRVFRPKRIQADDWTNGVWLSQSQRLPTMMSSPGWEKNPEAVDRVFKGHGLGFDSVITTAGHDAARITFTPPPIPRS